MPSSAPMSRDRAEDEARHPVLATVLMSILRAIDRDSSEGCTPDEGLYGYRRNRGSEHDPEEHSNRKTSKLEDGATNDTNEYNSEDRTDCGHAAASNTKSTVLHTINETEEEDPMSDEHDVNRLTNRREMDRLGIWNAAKCDVVSKLAEQETEEEMKRASCRGAPNSPLYENVMVRSSTSSPLVTSDDSDVASFLTKKEYSVLFGESQGGTDKILIPTRFIQDTPCELQSSMKMGRAAVPTCGNHLGEVHSDNQEEINISDGNDLHRTFEKTKQDFQDNKDTYTPTKNMDKEEDSEISSFFLKESTTDDKIEENITTYVSLGDHYNHAGKELSDNSRKHDINQNAGRKTNPKAGELEIRQTDINQRNTEPNLMNNVPHGIMKEKYEEYMTKNEQVIIVIPEKDQSSAVNTFKPSHIIYKDKTGERRSVPTPDISKPCVNWRRRNAERILKNSLEHGAVDETAERKMENASFKNVTDVRPGEKAPPSSLVLNTIAQAEVEYENKDSVTDKSEIKGLFWRHTNAERILKNSIKQNLSAEEAEWEDDMVEHPQVSKTLLAVDSTCGVDHPNQENWTTANLENIRLHRHEPLSVASAASDVQSFILHIIDEIEETEEDTTTVESKGSPRTKEEMWANVVERQSTDTLAQSVDECEDNTQFCESNSGYFLREKIKTAEKRTAGESENSKTKGRHRNAERILENMISHKKTGSEVDQAFGEKTMTCRNVQKPHAETKTSFSICSQTTDTQSSVPLVRNPTLEELERNRGICCHAGRILKNKMPTLVTDRVTEQELGEEKTPKRCPMKTVTEGSQSPSPSYSASKVMEINISPNFEELGRYWNDLNISNAEESFGSARCDKDGNMTEREMNDVPIQRNEAIGVTSSRGFNTPHDKRKLGTFLDGAVTNAEDHARQENSSQLSFPINLNSATEPKDKENEANRKRLKTCAQNNELSPIPLSESLSSDMLLADTEGDTSCSPPLARKYCAKKRKRHTEKYRFLPSDSSDFDVHSELSWDSFADPYKVIIQPFQEKKFVANESQRKKLPYENKAKHFLKNAVLVLVDDHKERQECNASRSESPTRLDLRQEEGNDPKCRSADIQVHFDKVEYGIIESSLKTAKDSRLFPCNESTPQIEGSASNLFMVGLGTSNKVLDNQIEPMHDIQPIIYDGLSNKAVTMASNQRDVSNFKEAEVDLKVHAVEIVDKAFDKAVSANNYGQEQLPTARTMPSTLTVLESLPKRHLSGKGLLKNEHSGRNKEENDGFKIDGNESNLKTHASLLVNEIMNSLFTAKAKKDTSQRSISYSPSPTFKEASRNPKHSAKKPFEEDIKLIIGPVNKAAEMTMSRCKGENVASEMSMEEKNLCLQNMHNAFHNGKLSCEETINGQSVTTLPVNMSTASVPNLICASKRAPFPCSDGNSEVPENRMIETMCESLSLSDDMSLREESANDLFLFIYTSWSSHA